MDDSLDRSNLLPSDAAHLALAARYAHALITNDAEFARATMSNPGRRLTVYIV
jgi:predicted nucleic acid-binding protein